MYEWNLFVTITASLTDEGQMMQLKASKLLFYYMSKAKNECLWHKPT